MPFIAPIDVYVECLFTTKCIMMASVFISALLHFNQKCYDGKPDGRRHFIQTHRLCGAVNYFSSAHLIGCAASTKPFDIRCTISPTDTLRSAQPKAWECYVTCFDFFECFRNALGSRIKRRDDCDRITVLITTEAATGEKERQKRSSRPAIPITRVYL